jgi:hypothetical protein
MWRINNTIPRRIKGKPKLTDNDLSSLVKEFSEFGHGGIFGLAAVLVHYEGQED